MPKKEKFYPCSIPPLKGKDVEAAIETAKNLNPVNAPAFGVVTTAKVMRTIKAKDDDDEVLPPSHLGVLVSRYWGQGGVNLTVSFMETAPSDLKARILEHMNSWQQFANVKFSLVGSDGQVRITRNGGGYWSYLGTDVLQIPRNQPTMSLEGFTMRTSEAEYRRVVRHETGHTLGMPHEHMRKAIIDKLDYEKTIAYFMRTQGWSRQDVIYQVLTPLEESQLIYVPGFETAEETSIMCYQLPGQITKDGKPIMGGSDITAMDGAYTGKVYPREPVTPQPPAGTTIVRLEIVGDVKSVKILEGPPAAPETASDEEDE